MIVQKEDGHFDYEKALTLCQLNSLFSRRENRTITFGRKCVRHKTMKNIFPLNSAIFEEPHIRSRELSLPCEPCQNSSLPELSSSSHPEEVEPDLQLLPYHRLNCYFFSNMTLLTNIVSFRGQCNAILAINFYIYI